MPLPLRRLLVLVTAFAGSLPGWATAIALFGVVSPASAQQHTIEAFNGVEVVITDFGFGSSTIMVVDGKSTGCQGDLPTEFIATATSGPRQCGLANDAHWM